MIDRYGYFTGTAIAVACVAVAFYTGAKYQETFMQPCIANYHSETPPYLGWSNQKLLESDVVYAADSDLAKEGYATPNEFIKAVFDMRSEGHEYVFVNERTEKEFFVPMSCYVRYTDGFGNPVLFGK